MKKKIIYALIVIVIIGIAGGAYGLYLFYKPAKNFATSKAEITMTAKQIFDEFTSNQDAANQKYVSKDKTIQLSGMVKEISKNQDGSIIIRLDVSNPDGDVSCTIVTEQALKVDKYKLGTNITVKGQCTGYEELISKEVQMIGCAIID